MRILITGAARAIGATTARVLTERGHEVVATARELRVARHRRGGAAPGPRRTDATRSPRRSRRPGQLDVDRQ